MIKFLAFNPMWVGLVGQGTPFGPSFKPKRPRGAKPLPPNQYRRGLWAQVFYTDRLLGRGNTYIANYPVERSTPGNSEWFDVEFEKGLIVTRINYFKASKYLGHTIVKMQNDITGLGLNTKYLKQ